MPKKKPYPNSKTDYHYFLKIPTRWMDNDVYHHVNNVVYYSFFDTTVNQYLIENQVLEFKNGETIGLVVETLCNYFKPITFPDVVQSGLRVSNIGNSSVRYEVALFNKQDQKASAQGHFIHVYVNKVSRKPTKISSKMKEALEKIAIGRLSV